jgi:hypothetical protein
MAGNVGDLLKQATQAMMARYEIQILLILAAARTQSYLYHGFCTFSQTPVGLLSSWAKLRYGSIGFTAYYACFACHSMRSVCFRCSLLASLFFSSTVCLTCSGHPSGNPHHNQKLTRGRRESALPWRYLITEAVHSPECPSLVIFVSRSDENWE